MIFPYRSFVLAIISYFLILFFISYEIKNNLILPEISLEIDAEIIGDLNQHQSSAESVKTTKKIQVNENRIVKNRSEEEQIEPLKSNSKQESTNLSSQNTAQKITPIFQPLPEIPYEMRSEAFASLIVARFTIAKTGEVSFVELIQPSSNPKLNNLLLKSLYKWRFNEASQESIQEIRVNFKVE